MIKITSDDYATSFPKIISNDSDDQDCLRISIRMVEIFSNNSFEWSSLFPMSMIQDWWQNHHGDLLKIIRGIITNYSHDQNCFRSAIAMIQIASDEQSHLGDQWRLSKIGAKIITNYSDDQGCFRLSIPMIKIVAIVDSSDQDYFRWSWDKFSKNHLEWFRWSRLLANIDSDDRVFVQTITFNDQADARCHDPRLMAESSRSISMIKKF